MPFTSLYYLIALPKTFSTMLNKGSVSGQLHLVPYIRGKALNLLPLSIILAVGFPGGSDGQESTCSVGDLGSTLAWEDPLEEGMAPTPVF